MDIYYSIKNRHLLRLNLYMKLYVLTFEENKMYQDFNGIGGFIYRI